MNYYEAIYNNIESVVKKAALDSIIPPELLFALCCNESGLWLAKNELIPLRFEPHVLNFLRLVKKGEKHDYKGIVMNDLIELSPDKLQEASCSYGITQIMGWWKFFIPFDIEQIKTDNLKALHITITILTLPQDKQPIGNESALQYINEFDYESVFRIWNTGKHDGKTYDDDYVKNGFKATLMWLKYNQ